MFDILVTIMGDLESEADAMAFAQDLEDCVAKARRLGAIVEVWDNRRATVIRRRTLMLPIDHDPR